MLQRSLCENNRISITRPLDWLRKLKQTDVIRFRCRILTVMLKIDIHFDQIHLFPYLWYYWCQHCSALTSPRESDDLFPNRKKIWNKITLIWIAAINIVSVCRKAQNKRMRKWQNYILYKNSRWISYSNIHIYADTRVCVSRNERKQAIKTETKRRSQPVLDRTHRTQSRFARLSLIHRSIACYYGANHAVWFGKIQQKNWTIDYLWSNHLTLWIIVYTSVFDMIWWLKLWVKNEWRCRWRFSISLAHWFSRS